MFGKDFAGTIYKDFTSKVIYSTDASAYRETPELIVLPKNKKDIQSIINYAVANGKTIIPRAAGTSLAGQVVGNGIIVDCSKHFRRILEVNQKEKWVRIEPGVVLDELNMHLKPFGLFFGPETSTSNRCMIGGMVGNNSCGAHSLIYGSTRDHVLELTAFLSDGSEVHFKDLTVDEFNAKCEMDNLEGQLYRNIRDELGSSEVQEQIRSEFPDPRIERRNTGYAIDVLLEMSPFSGGNKKFNFSQLVCGSEGTLAFVTEIKLNLVDLPPKEKGLLVVHLDSVEESLKANLVALDYNPAAIELFDKIILDCTKNSIGHSKNRFFIEGDPGALLCVEFARESRDEIEKTVKGLITELQEKNFGYHYPLLFGSDISKVWSLRKAGLGLLSNIPGDAKPQPVIEDTAVHPEFLPQYIQEFDQALDRMGMSCVYYAHIATGELHLRPVINLKTEEGVKQFRAIAEEIAKLVKKYKGSLSGEHGDGRLRGEFIAYMIGEKNYEILRSLKKAWDPSNVFNANKILDTPPMDSFLRYNPKNKDFEFETIFDFPESDGMLRMAEKCNGSADCRKSEIIGGTMCPSFQASRDEGMTTRARANMLREIISLSKAPFQDKELYGVLDMCLSCKGCKSECPSGVDMAKMKAEFLHQYYMHHRIPIRTKLISIYTELQKIASKAAGFYNWLITINWTSWVMKTVVGFSTKRSLPKVYSQSFESWLKKNLKALNNKLSEDAPQVCLFIDEFTNYNDVPVGKSTTWLLNSLGHRILTKKFKESGRSKLSKGILDRAQRIAGEQVNKYKEIISDSCPLVGIEPSAILSFRDEYPDLLRGQEKEDAKQLAAHVYTIEEFLAKLVDEGKLKSTKFHDVSRRIVYHGHCQQKAISGNEHAQKILGLPTGYEVEVLNSGCCGMAGSFGYEKEHFNLSMKVGELVLFPAIRKELDDSIICASGTSCRHQIKDGTGRIAMHPSEVLYEGLK